ncbi:MAG: 3-deoxy-D-manno-octulosonic acid kinase [Candidimonas sp.]|jgi:3-deoxy-D-manno-octulosonic acid kinase
MTIRDIVVGQSVLRVDQSLAPRADLSLFDPQAPGMRTEPVAEGGRQAAWFVQGDFGQAVLRRYRRGGLVARLSRDQYVWTGKGGTRSFAEFDLLHLLRKRGVRVPAPIAAMYSRHGLFYRAAILTRRIPGAVPLALKFEEGHHEAVAQAIFDMHQQDVWHADLNAYNILFDEQDRVWLIDFDKGRRRNLSIERREANLRRLRRSLIKIAGAPGVAWWEGLEHAYARISRLRSPL